MRHLLHDPHFPDIVGEIAISQVTETRTEICYCANDNRADTADELSDPLFAALCKAEIEATRLW